MSKLLVLACMLVPAIAAADWSVVAPKGWKRVPAASEAQAEKAAADQLGVRVEIRQWSSGKADNRMLTAMLLVLPRPKETPTELADALADSTADGIAARGFTKAGGQTRMVGKQAVAARMLSSDTMRFYLTARAQANAKRSTHVLLVQCGDAVGGGDCQRAVASAMLSP